MNGLGVYIHIPYCLQRCTYCDFATYVHTEILPQKNYVELLKREILFKKNIFEKEFAGKNLATIYFGGGTPSLLRPEFIIDIISELSKHGFTTGPQTEITIEINPATVSPENLDIYLKNGVNRFSVGAQSFNDRLLKSVNREHNALQTVDTLQMLKAKNLNFSFDLLFALPTQTVSELKFDVEKAVEFGSSHISPYCLTVPEGHPLSKNRPLEDEQLEMFQIIDEALLEKGFQQYEISNYAKPGLESRHNLLYWTDRPYWGIGLSAHSYSKNTPWGTRFWNVNNIQAYEKQILELNTNSKLPDSQKEDLDFFSSLIDFCHTRLRLSEGIPLKDFQAKFGPQTTEKLLSVCFEMAKSKVLNFSETHISLTRSGQMVSNQVFEKLYLKLSENSLNLA